MQRFKMTLKELKIIIDSMYEKTARENTSVKVKVGDGHYHISHVEQFCRDSSPVIYLDVKRRS